MIEMGIGQQMLRCNVSTNHKQQMTNNLFLHTGLVLCLVAGTYGCGQVSTSGWNFSNLRIGSNVTPIRNIKPAQDHQATVYVQGKVERQVPMLQRWAYQIDDSTGKIWVLTNQTNLEIGQEVVVKGKVRYKSIPVDGMDLGEVYVEEQL